MLDRERLLELAERCEKATADQQSDCLWKVFVALHDKPTGVSISVHDRFAELLTACAFLDAAITLKADGRVILNIAEDGITTAIVDGTEATADTAALALTAACLRSLASQENRDAE